MVVLIRDCPLPCHLPYKQQLSNPFEIPLQIPFIPVETVTVQLSFTGLFKMRQFINRSSRNESQHLQIGTFA